MNEVRGGPRRAARTRDRIAASASGNTRVNANYVAPLQGGRAPSPLAPRRARRSRLIGRIESAPDRDARWSAFIWRIGQLLDNDDTVDHLLGAIVEAPPEAIAIFADMGGGAR
jgi:hypothetical protein